MSIAVSAVLRPSRLLRAALLAYGAANLGAGLLLAAMRPAHAVLPILVAACCLLAGALALRAGSVRGKTRRIDISGLGRMHLTVQQGMGSAVAARAEVELLGGSTVWPQAMLLLLRAPEGGARTVLAVLPDSVQADQFRALGVAIRAIAARQNGAPGAHKIL